MTSFKKIQDERYKVIVSKQRENEVVLFRIVIACDTTAIQVVENNGGAVLWYKQYKWMTPQDTNSCPLKREEGGGE